MMNLLQFLVNHRDPERAIKYAKQIKAQDSDPQFVSNVNSTIARAFLQTGQPDQAIKIFEEQRDACGEALACRNQFILELINTLHSSGEYERALKELKALADSDINAASLPTNSNLIAGLFPDAEEADEAFFSYFKKTLAAMEARNEKDGNYYTAMNNLAWRYLQSGRPLKAEKYHKKVLAECDIEMAKLQTYEGLFLYNLNRGEIEIAQKLVKEMETNLKERKSLMTVMVMKADLLNKQDKVPEAIKMLETAFKDDCGDSDDCCRVLNLLFHLYRVSGDQSKLRSLLKKSLESNPTCYAVQQLQGELAAQ
jgi:tetratricopeptide (TPR) repeat protein